MLFSFFFFFFFFSFTCIHSFNSYGTQEQFCDIVTGYSLKYLFLSSPNFFKLFFCFVCLVCFFFKAVIDNFFFTIFPLPFTPSFQPFTSFVLPLKSFPLPPPSDLQLFFQLISPIHYSGSPYLVLYSLSSFFYPPCVFIGLLKLPSLGVLAFLPLPLVTTPDLRSQPS